MTEAERIYESSAFLDGRRMAASQIRVMMRRNEARSFAAYCLRTGRPELERLMIERGAKTFVTGDPDRNPRMLHSFVAGYLDTMLAFAQTL